MKLRAEKIAYIAISTVWASTMALAHAGEIPWPKLKTGIWALAKDVEMNGQKPTHFPEGFTTSCHDPSSEMRGKAASLEKEGCQVKLVSVDKTKISLTEICPGPEASAEDTRAEVIMESSGPSQIKTTLTSNGVRSIMTGRWVRECPPD
jgi:hypothetical protein